MNDDQRFLRTIFVLHVFKEKRIVSAKTICFSTTGEFFFIPPPPKKKKKQKKVNFKNGSKCGLFFLKGFTATFDKKKEFATSQKFFFSFFFHFFFFIFFFLVFF